MIRKAAGATPEKPNIYAIALGSNRALSHRLPPPAIVDAAFNALNLAPLTLLARSSIIASRPIGPSTRVYANAAALVATELEPLAMLDHLQAIERHFHRRRYRRWGPRTLDLDLLLWSGGRFHHKRLAIPHPALSERAFVLAPLNEIAPRWRVPRNHLTIGQLLNRLLAPSPSEIASSPEEHRNA